MLLPVTAPPGPVRIGLTDPVRAGNAPVPRDDSERVVFRQLYETLIEVDCTGTVRPALARSWESAEAGRVWRFKLRSTPRFWDGSPVEVADIVNAWSEQLDRSSSGDPLTPRAWVRPDSVTLLPDGRLQVALTAPAGSEPLLFVHPSLRVTRDTDADPWPLGTGPFRPLREAAIGENERLLVCARNPLYPSFSAEGAEIRFHVAPGADPRDLIPDRADAVLTGDAEAIEYADTLPGFRATPLPAERTYVLLSPRFRAAGGEEPVWILPALREQLRRDAFARDATIPPSPVDPESCGVTLPSRSAASAPSGLTERIVYPASDREAERLAERLSALSRAGGGSSPSELAASPFFRTVFGEGRDPVAEPLPWATLLDSLRSGVDAAYVLALHRTLPDPCLESSALLASVPWLRCAAGGCGRGDPGLRPEAVVVGLIETRLHLLHRIDLSGVEMAWDGIPLLRRAGRASQEAVP